MSASGDLDALGSWNPMAEDYASRTFNSYDRGPGANFPNGLSPALRNSGDSERPDSSNVSVYVSGIPLEMSEDGVKHFFGQVALPKAVRIKKPKDFSQGSTYCFVEMASVRDADAVMREFNGKPCGRFTLKVRPSRPRVQSEEPYNNSQQREPQKVTLYASQGQSQRGYSSSDSGSQRDLRPSQPPIRTMENRYGKSSPAYQGTPDMGTQGGRGGGGRDSPPPLDDRSASPERSRTISRSPVNNNNNNNAGIRRSSSSGRLDGSAAANPGTFTDKYSQFRGSMAGQQGRSPHQQQPAVPNSSGRGQSPSPQGVYNGEERMRRSHSISDVRDGAPVRNENRLYDRGQFQTSPEQKAGNFERTGQSIAGFRASPSHPEGSDRTAARLPTISQKGSYINDTGEEPGERRQMGSSSPKPNTPQHSDTTPGSADRPALPCLLCGQLGKSRCSRCKKPYCGKECQQKHWPEHKNHCRPAEESEGLTGFENFEVSTGDDVKEKMDALLAMQGIQMPTEASQRQPTPPAQPSPSPQQAAPPPGFTVANMERAKLPRDQTVDVLVTEVVSPENISVQIVNTTLLEMNQLMEEMKQSYQGTSNEGNTAYNPLPGELCAGLFDDGTGAGWYRASVDGVNPDGTLSVTYVDYGNSENIPVARVRKLEPGMTKIPLLAVKCSLLGLAGMGGGSWSSEVVNFLKAKVNNKLCHVTMKEEEAGTAVVEMVDSETGKSVAEMVLDTGLIAPTVPCQKPPKPPPDPQEDFGFVVTHINSPASLYGQVCYGSDGNALVEDITKKTQPIAGLPEAISQGKQEPYMPQLGEMCCAQWEADKAWYRAEVLEITSEGQLKVLFFDYGNTAIVTTANTRPIPEGFTECPPLALHCKLAGVSPLSGDRWSQQVIDHFKEMAQNKLLIGTPVAREGDVLSVEFREFATGIRLSEEMVRAGAAAFSKNQPEQAAARSPAVTPAAAAQPSLVSPAGEVRRSPSSQLQSSATQPSPVQTPQPAIRSQTPPSYNSPPQKQPSSSPSPQPTELQPSPQSRPGSARRARMPTANRVQPPASGRFDVLLKCVRSPGQFYCQLTEPSGVQNLQMLSKEISHYCQGLPPDPKYFPDLGEFCCVNSPDGRNWLRAQVQEHRLSNKVQIECLDIGKSVQVSQARLRPAQPHHMDFPVQVFKASLGGVVPVDGGEWSKQSLALLSGYVDSQRLTAQVVGQEGDRYVLDLWDRSGGQEQSLSMLLFEQGLAEFVPKTPEGSPPPSKKLPRKSSQSQATNPSPVQNGHAIGSNPVENLQNGGLEKAQQKASLATAVGTAGGTAEEVSISRKEWQEMKQQLAQMQQQLTNVYSLVEQVLYSKRS